MAGSAKNYMKIKFEVKEDDGSITFLTPCPYKMEHEGWGLQIEDGKTYPVNVGDPVCQNYCCWNKDEDNEDMDTVLCNYPTGWFAKKIYENRNK